MSADPATIPDASDEVTTNNRSRDQSRYVRDDADVVRKTMMSKHGRSWIYRLLEACHIYETPFTPGQSDTTAFRLGEANIGNRLLAQIMTASGDLYLTMIQEAREEEQRLAKQAREQNTKRADEDRQAAQSGGAHDLPAPSGFSK